MKFRVPLCLLALTLTACAPVASDPGVVKAGGSAGSEPPGYCDSPPQDMSQLAHWNQLCTGKR